MKLKSLLLVTAWVAAASLCPAEGLLGQISEMEQAGRFQEAARLLQTALTEDSLSASNRRELRFELDRLERIKKDFPYSADELFAELQPRVKGLTREEFNQWVDEGRFDSRKIDGSRRFMTSSVSNLFFRYPALRPRRRPPRDAARSEQARYDTCVAIRHAAETSGRPYVLPKRFEVTMTVKTTPNVAPDGDLIRAWLPVPRRYPFQTGFELLSPRDALVAPEDSPIRSLYLERVSRQNQPTEFGIRYRYTAYGVWFNVQPARIASPDKDDPALQPFLSEAPHVVFTPEMRTLSRQIAGSETNLWLRAKKFHDWIAENIQYSYAIEYSTIRNIGDYCRSRRYGDCGQEALLFITLCRLNGIPARWQSGWNTFPGAKTIHDWAEIFLPPYGWMPVDPYMGIFAMQYADNLSPAQKREVRDFYFGGLDQYRMAANSDHSRPLTPPKQSLRSDTVDFQRGELESGDQNIYFDRYSYRLDIREISLDKAE